MSNIENPPAKPSATRQLAMYRQRRNHAANAVVGTLTAWSHGLVVTAGMYVQNDGNAYVALTSGTTGTIAPVGVTTAALNDGGVEWQFVNNRTFLTNQTPSTPA